MKGKKKNSRFINYGNRKHFLGVKSVNHIDKSEKVMKIITLL